MHLYTNIMCERCNSLKNMLNIYITIAISHINIHIDISIHVIDIHLMSEQNKKRICKTI